MRALVRRRSISADPGASRAVTVFPVCGRAVSAAVIASAMLPPLGAVAVVERLQATSAAPPSTLAARKPRRSAAWRGTDLSGHTHPTSWSSSSTVLHTHHGFGVGCVKIRSRRGSATAARHDEGMDLISEQDSGGADLGYRALVVDDEAALADVVASYLHRDHFEVTVCYTGAEALAVAREVDPDVVVLDLGLPGIDGLEVCRQLRTFSDAYVVMLTARDTEMDTIVGLSVGADDYVTKPFSPRELVARIRAMLRRPRAAAAAAVPHTAEAPPGCSARCRSTSPAARSSWTVS